MLSPVVIARYETLRGEVLCGRARPEGLSAVIYHGLVQGLLLLTKVTPECAPPEAPAPCLPIVRTHPDFLHLLANMVLRSHTGVTHVY